MDEAQQGFEWMRLRSLSEAWEGHSLQVDRWATAAPD
jgi:hypothetical protein